MLCLVRLAVISSSRGLYAKRSSDLSCFTASCSHMLNMLVLLIIHWSQCCWNWFLTILDHFRGFVFPPLNNSEMVKRRLICSFLFKSLQTSAGGALRLIYHHLDVITAVPAAPRLHGEHQRVLNYQLSCGVKGAQQVQPTNTITAAAGGVKHLWTLVCTPRRTPLLQDSDWRHSRLTLASSSFSMSSLEVENSLRVILGVLSPGPTEPIISCSFSWLTSAYMLIQGIFLRNCRRW